MWNSSYLVWKLGFFMLILQSRCAMPGHPQLSTHFASVVDSEHSLNRMAFCLLGDIPDLWLHLNTIRVTELLCLLNSKNSDAGLSTVARFCTIMGCPDLTSAAKRL